MNTKVELGKFSENYLTPFIESFILVEKVEKGIFARPFGGFNNE